MADIQTEGRIVVALTLCNSVVGQKNPKTHDKSLNLSVLCYPVVAYLFSRCADIEPTHLLQRFVINSWFVNIESVLCFRKVRLNNEICDRPFS